jgi:hypothetical protein
MNTLNELNSFLHLQVRSRDFKSSWNPTKSNVCIFVTKNGSSELKHKIIYTEFVKVSLNGREYPLYMSKENKYYILVQNPLTGSTKPLKGIIRCYDTQMDRLLKGLNLFGNTELRYLKSL